MKYADMFLLASQVWFAASFIAGERGDGLICFFFGVVWLSLAYYAHRKERM